ncbi:hypothetical protein ACSZMK_22475, partial [Aeromonas caviae]
FINPGRGSTSEVLDSIGANQKGFSIKLAMRLLKNDNQLAMLFTLANLFRADQMIRQWERSH